MARWEISWDDADGSSLKRFSRSLPVEAWLKVRDLDGEGPSVVFPVSVSTRDITTMNLGAIFKLVAEAVNTALRYVETETIPAADESSIGSPVHLPEMGAAHNLGPTA